MTTIRVGQAVQLLYAKGWGPGCLANTDLVNPVFFGHGQDLSPSSDQIPALGAIPVDGSRDIYGSTLASGISVAVQSMPGVTNWAPSPAQVSAQINALGLARDTTVGTVATNTGNVHTDLALGTNAFLGGTSTGALVSVAGRSVAQDVNAVGINHALPVQQGATQGPFAANASWGPFSITFTVGTAYMLAFFAQVSSNPFITDVLVTHKDAGGNILYVEEFCIGNLANIANFPLGPVIIRGNLHGPTITVSGQTASSAFINSLSGGAFTAGSIKVAAYALPEYLPDSKPKIISAGFSGNLAAQSNIALAANANVNLGALPSYAGQFTLSQYANTGGGGSSLQSLIFTFTVAGGTTALWGKRYFLIGTANQESLELDTLNNFFHTYHMINNSGTVAGAMTGILDAVDAV